MAQVYEEQMQGVGGEPLRQFVASHDALWVLAGVMWVYFCILSLPNPMVLNSSLEPLIESLTAKSATALKAVKIKRLHC